jgi:hypothetical protein
LAFATRAAPPEKHIAKQLVTGRFTHGLGKLHDLHSKLGGTLSKTMALPNAFT